MFDLAVSVGGTATRRTRQHCPGSPLVFRIDSTGPSADLGLSDEFRRRAEPVQNLRDARQVPRYRKYQSKVETVEGVITPRSECYILGETGAASHL